ncbi:hypothetical protein CY34DRAFT_799046 [Suillus luteus UH-Slu-Lm8-n1]|uniref:Uncharacterized protein n=1 Tax=Suillus luteus UH-Slu-Lm8-n1 TaxID=930992 RepID=A0A0D0BD58_9AGAM|nr:hypothetical protein CY34DRAFT_799046 [Suillus luteus UH-Slu-Lm8-n1]
MRPASSLWASVSKLISRSYAPGTSMHHASCMHHLRESLDMCCKTLWFVPHSAFRCNIATAIT